MSRCSGVQYRLASLAVLSAALIAASPVVAQPACRDDRPRIVGLVIDATTDTPLEGAYVSVPTSDWESLTTDSGRFLLCWIGPGTHIVRVERLGYHTLIDQLEATVAGGPVHLRMTPDPILLEGLEVVTDRFEGRRRATPYPVRVYDQEDLASSHYWTAADFVESSPGVFTTQCGINRCIYRRGRVVRPTVYLDEFPMIGGWAGLQTLVTSQLYMIEIYGRGSHIRAYTHGFMERAARVRLVPLQIWQ